MWCLREYNAQISLCTTEIISTPQQNNCFIQSQQSILLSCCCDWMNQSPRSGILESRWIPKELNYRKVCIYFLYFKLPIFQLRNILTPCTHFFLHLWGSFYIFISPTTWMDVVNIWQKPTVANCYCQRLENPSSQQMFKL